MPNITDNYMNDRYKLLYKIELEKERALHREYSLKKQWLLKKELHKYCNQMSIIEDFNEGIFSPNEIEKYTKTIKLIIVKEKYNVKEYIYAKRNKMMLYFTKPSPFSYQNIKTIEEANREFEIKFGNTNHL